MRDKKIAKALVTLIMGSTTAFACLGTAACGSDKNDGEGQHEHTYSSEWSHDDKYHWHEPTCGDTDEVKDKEEHSYDQNGNCECGAHQHVYSSAIADDYLTHHFDPLCDDAETITENHKFENGFCTVCNARAVKEPTLTEDDDPVYETDEDGKIEVNYEFDAQNHDAATYENDLVDGIFTVKAGTTVRTRTRTELYDDNGNKIKDVNLNKSVQINSSSSTIEINAPAAGKLELYVQNGSSGGLTTQQFNLVAPNGAATPIIYRAEGSLLQDVVLDCPTAGVYKITRGAGGTSDIFYMSYTAKVENTPVESIEVASAGNVNYYVGQPFTIDGLSVNAKHQSTGRLEPIPTGRLRVNFTALNNMQAGTYEIKISYKKDGRTFNTSYNVDVYDFEGLTIGTDKIVQDKNSAAGNGVYANHSLRQLYFKGDTFSSDGLSVTLNGKNGEKTRDFQLTEKDYKLSAIDMNTVGKKTVTLTVSTNDVVKEGTFDIFVIEKDPALATAASVDVVVDQALNDSNIGVKGSEGYQFKTIHQALEFLENCGVSESAKKTINLKAGTYWEKLEINIPNLTIIGADRDTTKIEYDSLYGVKDAGGFEHTTDSTATLNVRDKAVGFTIKGVTVSNAYNSLEYFDKTLGKDYPEHRALAVLIQADRVIVDDCAFLGYQDTIELFTGRQYIMNSYISGTTDFIFGTNNTTYFYNCEIHSISNGKTDGGYITAFKGCNKGSGDYVNYGAIFDGCNFTADDDVVANGNTALGRPWGAYAAVAVINSEIGGHVSKTGFVGNGDSKNLRYVSMNAKPTDATVKFVEYNNTGDGAITEAVGGMTMLTETQAANYSDLSVIFGTANGAVTYDYPWIPVSPDAETYDVTVKNGDGESVCTVTVEAGAKLTMDALKGAIAQTSYAHLDISGVYTDAGLTTEYDFDTEVNANGEIYVVLEEGPFSEDTTFNFKTQDASNVVTTPDTTKYIGKLIVNTNTNGTFNINNDWYKLTGDATLTLNLKADTVVTLTDYDDSAAFTFNGTPLTVDFVSNTYTIEVRENGELVISKADGKAQAYIGVLTVDCDAGLSTTKSTVTLYNGATSVGTLQVWDGQKLTESGLKGLMGGVTAPEGQEFDAFYTDVNCTTPFDFNNAISADTPIYIGWKALPAETTTIASDVTYDVKTNATDVATGESKIINNMLITGGFTSNGSGWSQISNGGSLAIKIKADTVVTVTTYDGNLANATCEDYTVERDANGKIYTITALKDCELVISGDGAYVSTVNVNVKVVYSETTTINMGLITETYQSGQSGKFMGVEIDTSNGGKVAPNNNDGTWAQFNTGAVLKIYVAKGANVTVTFKTYNDAASATLDDSHIADGYVTITATTNGYIGNIVLTFA